MISGDWWVCPACIHFLSFFFCYDEMSAIIRSFHSSTSLDRATPPRPSCPFPFPHHTEPNHVGWEGLLYWVCGHGGGWVGAMRDTEDLPLDVWSSFFFPLLFDLWFMRLKLTSFLFLVSISVWSLLFYLCVNEKYGYIDRCQLEIVSTAIGLWKHRIPSDLRS
jgi:hypothetical protein